MLWATVFGALLVVTSAFNLPGVPIDFTASDEILSAISGDQHALIRAEYNIKPLDILSLNDIAKKFADEYVYFLKTGIETATLRQLSKQLAKAHSKKDLFTKDVADLGAADTFVMCTTCRATANVAARMVREDDGELNGPEAEENARKIMLDVCHRLELQTEEVCNGLFESNYPIIDYIVRETVIDSYSFCSLFMEYSFCNIKNPEYNWTLNIDTTGLPITGPKADVPKSGADDWTILHLTDIHHDPLYKPGALAECDEPLCCQRHENIAQGTSKAAGYWGDYRDCDFPWHTIEKTFEHIKKTHSKIDMIYQTGDVVDHMVWATSKEKNTDVLHKVDDKLAELFPGVPVYPCIGNHEPHPLNAFSPSDVPEDVSTKWMYEQLYKSWSRWLPESTKDTILEGGYYTVSPKPGFRIIALNNNDCYNMNWWLFYSGLNKQPQLLWLHETLLAAEKANEHVHILAHIPTGDGSCWSVWAREANKIYERFNKIISGIFNGHSHKDEMNVHYSSNGHPIGISWNGGALTTFSYKNPNYRLYHVETTTKQVVNHETWIFNLTLANEHGETVDPVFFKEYDFNTEFTTDLSPNGLDKLLDEFATKPDLLRKFWHYKMTSADPAVRGGCGRGCLMSTICRLATTVNDQKKRCHELMDKLAIALDDETSTAAPSTQSTPTTSSSTSSGTPTTASPTTASPTTASPTTPLTPTTSEGTTTSEQPPPEDDGATSMVSMSLSTLMGLLILFKCLF